MSSMNVNIGANIGRAASSGQGSATSVSTAQQATPSADSQVSYQNASSQTTMNLLTQRMLSNTTSLNALDARQLSMLVRELLLMPKEIQQLLAMLAFGDTNINDLATLFKDPKFQLLLKELQLLVGQNSKEVINKLIQLTQNNALMFEGSKQLRDILGLIQHVSAAIQSSPTDALTMAMVLYLPWLPLVEQQKFELVFGYEQDEKGQKTDSEVLVLFISTENIGTFKITIILDKDKKLDISIENDHTAAKIIKQLVKHINERLGASGLTPQIATNTRKEPEKRTPKQLKSDTSKSIKLHPSGKISAITVNTGYIIAKAIFTIDEKVGVLNLREEKIK